MPTPAATIVYSMNTVPMSNTASVLIGFVSGLIASLFSWLLVTRLIHPHIAISDKILLMPSVYKDNTELAKIKVDNRSWFDAFELNQKGRLYLFGLVDGKPDMYTTFVVNVGSGAHPYLPGTRKSRKEQTSGRLLRLHINKETNKKMACFLKELEPNREPTLGDYLKLDARNYLEVTVVCSHGFSLTRGIRTRRYCFDDISTGFFNDHGVDINRSVDAADHHQESDIEIPDTEEK